MKNPVLNAVDLARIATTVEDNAYRYYGGPLNLGASDTARYVSEGHLCRRGYSLNEAWPAVAAYIGAHSEVLHYTASQVEATQAKRQALCGDLSLRARQALRVGDREAALSLIAEAELVDPDWRTADFRTWDDIRHIVNGIEG